MIMNNPVSSFFSPIKFWSLDGILDENLIISFRWCFFCHPWASMTWWRNVRLMPLKLVNLMNETIFTWIESFWSMVASSPCTFISRTLAVETKWKIDWFLIGVWVQNSRSRHVLRGRDGPRLGTNSPFSVLKCPLWSLRYFRQRKKKLRKACSSLKSKVKHEGNLQAKNYHINSSVKDHSWFFFVWLRYKKGEKEVGVGRVIRGKCALLPLVWRRIVCKK